MLARHKFASYNFLPLNGAYQTVKMLVYLVADSSHMMKLAPEESKDEHTLLKLKELA